MPKKKPKKTLQRFLILGSTLAFLSTFAFALVSMFASSQSHSQHTANSSNSDLEARILQQVNGYQSVLERDPNNSYALQGLSQSLNYLRSFYMAELQQDPDNTEVLERITAKEGEIQNLYQQLDTSYQEALKKDPNDPVALNNLVNIRLQLRDAEGAIEPLQKLVELYPEETRYQNVLKSIQDEIAARKAAEKQEKEAKETKEPTAE